MIPIISFGEDMASLDLAALEIFCCVAQERSISGAAARLGRVQSNVSTRLKQLEEMLGAVLFVSTRRGLTLTEAGRTLMAYAERLMGKSGRQSAGEGMRGSVREDTGGR